MTYIVVGAIIQTATAFCRDTCCPTPEETFFTETSLSARLLTDGINAAGAGVSTVGTTQLILTVGRTVNCFISEERNDGCEVVKNQFSQLTLSVIHLQLNKRCHVIVSLAADRLTYCRKCSVSKGRFEH